MVRVRRNQDAPAGPHFDQWRGQDELSSNVKYSSYLKGYLARWVDGVRDEAKTRFCE